MGLENVYFSLKLYLIYIFILEILEAREKNKRRENMVYWLYFGYQKD
jgi:hypothetical protein